MSGKYKKSERAMKFIASFGEIKMITTVFGVIDMHINDDSNETLIVFDSSGEIKKRLSLSDVISLGDSSEQKEWMSFVLRVVHTHLKLMVAEITRKIEDADREDLLLIMKFLEESRKEVETKFLQESIDAIILSYNKKLEKSNIDESEALALKNNNSKYKDLLKSILEIFNYKLQSIQKVYQKRIIELANDEDGDAADESVVVDHRLRWNANDNDLAAHFLPLIQNKSVIANTGKHDENEIMNVLNMVFEEVYPTKSRREKEESNGKLPIQKVPFTIPFQLRWTTGSISLKRSISSLLKDPKIIFVEKFTDTQRGETPQIAEILRQVMVVPKDDNTGIIKKSVLISRLNDND